MGEQVGIWEKMLKIQESSERQEDILQDLVNQTKASSDVMESFTWGEFFLRIEEMGKQKGPEEVESVLRRHRRRLSRMGFLIQLKRNKLEIGQGRTL